MKDFKQKIIDEELRGLRGSIWVALIVNSIIALLVYIMPQNPKFALTHIVLLALIDVIVLIRLYSSIMVIRYYKK